MPPNTEIGTRRIYNKPVRRMFIKINVEKSDAVVKRRYQKTVKFLSQIKSLSQKEGIKGDSTAWTLRW